MDDIRKLLDAGVNPNALDHWRVTPMMTLVRQGAETGYKESVELLLARGAHIYDVTTSMDSAIDQAVERGVPRLARSGPRGGAGPVHPPGGGPAGGAGHVFHHPGASVEGRVLDQPVPDVNRHPDRLRPALYYAVLQKRPEFVARLLEKGADPNIRDPQGRPLLVFARAHSTEEIVDLLNRAGATGDAAPPTGILVKPDTG